MAEAGIGFCFAPRFHPAMRHAGPSGASWASPPCSTSSGPLANPAGVRRQVIGVTDPPWPSAWRGVLAARGAERALVVHGDDGLDELTITTTSQVVELRDGEVRDVPVDPTELGITPAPAEALVGGDPGDQRRARPAGARRRAGPPPRRRRASTPPPGWSSPAWPTTSPQGVAGGAGGDRRGAAAAALDRLVAVSNALRTATGGCAEAAAAVD